MHNGSSLSCAAIKHHANGKVEALGKVSVELTPASSVPDAVDRLLVFVEVKTQVIFQGEGEPREAVRQALIEVPLKLTAATGQAADA